MTKRVAIYGGGVAGMSAAHELSRRTDFEVHVYESTRGFGGKARSQYLLGTGAGGRRDLPGEHGFRFYPHFYRHLDETLKQIPYGDRCVFDNLISSEEFGVGSTKNGFATTPRRLAEPTDLRDAQRLLHMWFEVFDLTILDSAALVGAVLRILTSSEVRRQEQIDNQSWFEYSGAEHLSEAYQAFTATMPRTMVAMDGERGSAYTIGKVGSQLFFLERDQAVDRVMNGPTDERWLRPWFEYLKERLGVAFHQEKALVALELERVADGARVRRARLSDGGLVEADYHVCAVPLEKMLSLVGEDLAQASPSLARLRELRSATDWMVGAQYFLREPMAKMPEGHMVYPESEWALTSINQGVFWQQSGQSVEASYGDGSVRDILSVDISNWNRRSEVTGKSARQHTRNEVLAEVLRQLAAGLNHAGEVLLDPRDVVAQHLDSNVKWGGPEVVNETPLLVHPPGSWQLRPAAQTELANLLLAADYVATYTNLATMEGANEAAKRAVRSILTSEGIDNLPSIHQLQEPKVFETFRRIDEWLYRNGKPHVLSAPGSVLAPGLGYLGFTSRWLRTLLGRRSPEKELPTGAPDVLEAFEAALDSL